MSSWASSRAPPLRSTWAGQRHRAIGRGQALGALADGIRACIRCRPDTELGVLGQVGRRSSREKHLSHHPYQDCPAGPRPVHLGRPAATAVSSGGGVVRAPSYARTYEHASAP
ncbi:DUF6233 domain-containing protein [Streptomyces sp. NPDC005248]|uniref:DUF6233 domain-containing protein n=1 Tax=Streptomyces sp. NPDC005248 TaxID=3364709 RepID=UPI0036B73068